MLHHNITRISLNEWHSFAAGFQERHVFHHAGWIQSLVDTYHFPLEIYAVRHYETGEILTALPFMRVFTLEGKRKWVCLPFTDFFPVLGDQRLAVQMVKYLHSEGMLKGEIEIRIELPNDESFHYSIGQVSHMLRLSKDETALYNKLSSHHLRYLKQGYRRGTSVNINQSLEAMQQYYQLQLQVRHNKGLPTQPWKFFENIYKNLIAQQCGAVALAINQNGVYSGGKVVLYWGDTITSKFVASDYSLLKYRPNHLTYWEMIQWAASQDYLVFDFGKTTLDNEGLCRFKCGVGATQEILRYTYLGIDEDVPMSERYDSGMVGKVSKVIQRSPLFVSRLSGELFYRFFA